MLTCTYLEELEFNKHAFTTCTATAPQCI